MTSPKISLLILSLASLSLIPTARAACAVSGVPTFSGGLGIDGYGNIFYTSSGGTGTVSIGFTTASGCTYYVSSDSSWMTTSVSTATQNSSTSASVSFTVAADSAAAGTRTGHLTVYVNAASASSTGVDQNSSNCVFTFTTPNQTLPAAGGNFTLSFNNGGCLYWGPSTPSWAPVTTYNAGYVILSIAQNMGAARSGAVVMTSPSASYPLTQAASVSPPTLTSISPTGGSAGTNVSVTLTGTNFVSGGTTVNVSSGASVSSVNVISATQISAIFAISGAASGSANVSVTTSGGTSGTVPFSYSPPMPTLTSVSPNSGVRGSSVAVTLTGTNFIAGSSVSAGNAGITVSGVTVVSSTQITATFAISASASGNGSVSVSTPGGTTGPVTFTITAPTPPTVTAAVIAATGTGTCQLPAGQGSFPTTAAQVWFDFQYTGGGAQDVYTVQWIDRNGTLYTSNTFTQTGTGGSYCYQYYIAIAGYPPASLPGNWSVKLLWNSTQIYSASFSITNTPTPPMVTSAVTAATGTCPSLPSGQSSFSTSASQAWFDFLYTGGGANDIYTIEWFEPNGTQYTSNTFTQTSTGGNYCYQYFITIAGYPPASLPGAWNVKLLWNSTQIYSAPFSIAQAASTPTLTSISPTSGAQGTSVPVTLNGTNFIAGATVNTGNAGVTAINQNVVSSTQITATLVIASNATGSANVSVTTTGGTSNAVTFSITSPQPTLTSISPTSGAAGTNVPVTLTGTNFISGASVSTNNAGITVGTPTVVSSTQISTTFVIAPGAAAGSASVTVTTSGGTTAAVMFTVTSPITLISISPNNGAAGASVPVTLSGSNFVSGATTVNVGGGITVSNLSVISSSQLNATFVIPAGALGSVNVSVTTAAGTSANIPFTVTAPQPTITSVVPSSTTAGGPSFNLTVNGSGFASGATVNWGSQALSTTFVGSGLLTASVPASLIVTPGGVGITVTSGNVTTGALQFTINPSTVTTLKLTCSPATGPTTVGVSYLATCTASGGTAPYNWTIGSGALPQGLTSSGTAGTSITISGTPASAGSYSYSVKVTDSSATAQTQSQSYSGTIAAPPPTTVSLNCTGANGPSTVGVRYADTCTAPNGTAPFAWSISAGALPAGVNLNGSATGTATVSGTPTAAGPYSYTLTVSDSTSPTPLSGSQVFSGTIGQAGSPTLTVSPASLSFTYRPDTGLPVQQSLSLFTTGTATSFTVGVNGSWLTASPSGGQTPGNISVSVVNITGLAPGTYNGQVTVTALNVNPPSVSIPVSLVVQAVPQPQLTLGQTHFAYGLTQGSSAVEAQLLVTNPGGGVLSFTTQVTGCSCVSVSTASGQASAGTPAAVGFTVNPAGLPPSTYNSAIVITASDGETATVPIQTAVNSLAQSIVLTQTGLLFGTVAQGGAPPAQSFSIINAGQGTMSYSLSVQTLSGASGWLNVSPSTGSVAANAVSVPVVVTVNPSGLPVGQYYGLVQVIAPNAGNSPQVVSVLLNVVDPSQGAVLVSPTGVLVGSVAGANLTSPLTLYNLSNQALSYTSTVSTTDGGNWLVASPSSGTVPAEGSVQVTVSGNATALTAGTGQGVVRVGFSNGIVQSVGVSSLSVSATSSSSGADAQTSCQTSYLVPTLTGSIGPSFTVTQSQPVSLSVSVVDNCHNIAQSATVIANFSDGDPAITLVPQGNGVLTGTWTPKSAQAQMSVLFVASENFQGTKDIVGYTQPTGTVQPAASTEAPAPASALNSANASPATQISPGSWVTIFGDRMANGTQSASGTFPPSLVGTAVMIGSTALPLDYVGPTQVNALLPFSLTPNSTVSLAVQRSGTVSVPLAVTIADLGPAIFAINGAGTGQGAVTIASSGVLAAPVGAFPGSQPVARGDFLAIYCTGLGAVNNTPADGAPAPSSPPFATTLANPNVTIGGMPAVVSYSGLAPGLVGLYQVNVQVPNNAPTGDAVNLAISVGSLTSNTVTVAVQ